MVYLDTLIEVGLSFLNPSSPSWGRPSHKIDPAEIQKKERDLFQLIRLFIRYHLPRSHYRFHETVPFQELMEEDETLARALVQLEEVLVEKSPSRAIPRKAAASTFLPFSSSIVA